MNRQGMIELLESLSLRDVRYVAWQIDYDMVAARKRWPEQPFIADFHPRSTLVTLPNLLRCPHCENSPLDRGSNAYCCDNCGQRYPIADDGVIEMGF